MEEEKGLVAEQAKGIPELVVHASVTLASFAKVDDVFFEPKKYSEIEAVYAFLEKLSNGSVLPCRGRDVVRPKTGGSEVFGASELSPFDYGCATLNEGRVFFIWSDKVESFQIRQLDIRKLVHFVLVRPSEDLQKSIGLMDVPWQNVCVISHGYSPERGPQYALIRSLEKCALRMGWKPVVCCFLDSYRFGASRGRSERVKMIYEELLCLPQKPERVAFVGKCLILVELLFFISFLFVQVILKEEQLLPLLALIELWRR